MINMTALINTLIKIFIFVVIGYVARKSKIMDDCSNDRISKIIVNIAVPGMILYSVIGEPTELTTAQIWQGILVSFIWQGFLFAIGFLIAKIFIRPKNESRIYTLLFAAGNVGIFGFPVIEPLFGAIGLQYAAIANAMFDIYVFSIGPLLAADGRPSFKKLAKNFLTPAFIVAVLAPILLLLQLDYPAFVRETLAGLNPLSLPLLMFTVGSTMASQKPKEFLVSYPKTYFVLPVRLLLLPLIIAPLAYKLIPDPLLAGVIIVLSGTPVAGMATSLSLLYGSHAKESGNAVFLSTILSLLTVPLIAKLLIA